MTPGLRKVIYSQLTNVSTIYTTLPAVIVSYKTILIVMNSVLGTGDLLMSLFITAAGDSKRWKRYSPEGLALNKMEVDVYGKPLIQWTFDQLKARKKKFTLLTKNEVGNTRSVTETILA